jgi:hypothetical protein
MSKAAAQTFITAVKATRADFDTQTKPFYDRFIVGKAAPTADDVKKLADVIAKFEEVAKVYHTDVRAAMDGFGGPADMTIRNAKIMHATLLKKVQK